MTECCFDLRTGVLISEQQVIIKVFLNILPFVYLRMCVHVTFGSSSAKIDQMHQIAGVFILFLK